MLSKNALPRYRHRNFCLAYLRDSFIQVGKEVTGENWQYVIAQRESIAREIRRRGFNIHEVMDSHFDIDGAKKF